MKDSFDDKVMIDYVERWLNEGLEQYFQFLEIHYEILELRQREKRRLMKKYPQLKSSDLRKKLDYLQKKELGDKLTLFCKRKVDSFLS